MTQEIKKDMILHTIAKQLVRNWRTRVLSAAHSSSLTSALTQGRLLSADEITAHSSRDYGSCPTRLRLVISLLLMMVLGVGTTWGQEPVEITRDDDSSGAIDDSEKKLYLIQSYMNTAYYMRPNGDYASTNSLVSDQMEWYFEDAGVDGGTQYYYILNKKNGKYLYCVGNDNNKNAKFDTQPSSDLYKFKFVPNSSGTAYQIVVKGSTFPLVKTTGNWQAPGGNNNADVKVSNSNGEYSLWNFIPKSNYSKKLPHKAFVVSDASNQYYYKIQNNASPTLYISNVSTATIDSYDWRFEIASSSDEYLDYYYIIDRNGKYLRYKGEVNGNNQNSVLELVNYDSSKEQTFQFVVVRGSVSAETHDNPVITFSIVPKPVKDQRNENMFSLYSGATPQAVGTQKERNDNNACHWNFISETPICEDPVIAYSGDNNISISTGTGGATIYYTTDDSDPSDADNSSRVRVSGSSVTITVGEFTVVKAIAEKSGCLPSDVVTFNLTVDDPVINYNTSTDQVTITCGTQGASIYYTTDGSEPTTASTLYDGSGFALGNSNIIKTIAKKGGVISNVVSQSFINGLYYIKHATNDYRMYPSTTTDGSGNPRVTTQTLKDEEAVWEIRQQGDYYTIKHYTDSKYMWTADATVITNTVHLATAADTNDDKLLYEFTPIPSLSGVYTIRPKNAANQDGKNFLDTTSGDNGTNTIGLYHQGNGIRWEFVKIPSQPVITVNDIDVTITKTLGDIIYTTDGTDPLTSGTAITVTENSTTATLNYGKEYTVRAVSRYTDRETTPNYHYSAESTETVDVEVEQPVISVSSTNQVTFSTPQIHNDLITIRYNYDETANNPSDPTTTTGTVWDGSSSITLEDGKAYTIKAIAFTTEGSSSVRSLTVNLKDAEPIQSFAGIDDQAGNYYFADNFEATGSPSNGIGTTAEKAFKGKIDGKYKEISLGNSPLFEYVEDATIKNVIISSASVSTSGHAGAIANVAKGETRIYNCGVLGGTVSGSGYVGGIVGLLDGFSRVINCFSYADVTGGSDVGGIVGYNNGITTATSIQTMVMNCMFYGDIKGGTNISPVYGGNNINNLTGGLNTFNYYRYESPYSKNKQITSGKYNCALALEDKYLNRFEFYRQLLNSNKRLAAIYATGSADDAEKKIAKWVLETADRQNNNPMPFPILKAQGKYPSIINFDAEHAEQLTLVNGRPSEVDRYKGGKIGTLSVTISAPSGWTNKPSDAKLLDENGNEITTSRTITLNRTDKDEARFNFNYDKVQLPYYNDYGTKNYTSNKVVTGWKITSITPASGEGNAVKGNFKEEDIWGGYNFADRMTYAKDLYSKSDGGSGRVFSQGAYFDVPYGVTAITIEPYWGKAVYVADANYDVVYNNNNDYTVDNVTELGTQYANNTNITINGSQQKVYTKISDAVNQLTNSTVVYDNALVLVGNLHLANVPSNGSKGFTMMSIDRDKDNEPDYSLIYHHDNRKNISPIRFDFLNVPGTAMAQKPNGSARIRNVSIFGPIGWFEVTNTCNISIVQFECDNTSYSSTTIPKTPAPVIFQGGMIDQFVSTKINPDDKLKNTLYIHVGGTAWFNAFGNGTHSDGTGATPHVPVSVTGGDFEGFYLTGTYQPKVNALEDDAECYISGGRFKEAAGASQEQLKGNARWQIYDADIEHFYGGGINAANNITGNIKVDIFNSHVTQYCGGPKFGDMETGKTVTTEATGCTFGKYFGAGYGGISYLRLKYFDEGNTTSFATWDNQYDNGNNGDRGKYFDGTTTNANNDHTDYGQKGPGVATDLDYEIFVWSSGQVGGRFYVKFASFSLATCNDVNSTLTNCIVNQDFYGGGSSGKVVGTATSTLNGCTVHGNVFGAGYKSEVEKVNIRDGGFVEVPKYNSSSGMFEAATLSGTTEYEWKHVSSMPADGITGIEETDGKKYIQTTADFNTLGQVDNTVLTITGNTQVDGRIVNGVNNGGVFGGGDESATIHNTEVTINTTGESAISNVYGGGNIAPVGGNTKVTLRGNTLVSGNVFGGGNKANVSGSATVNIIE